jgi:hypothetical protein
MNPVWYNTFIGGWPDPVFMGLAFALVAFFVIYQMIKHCIVNFAIGFIQFLLDIIAIPFLALTIISACVLGPCVHALEWLEKQKR